MSNIFYTDDGRLGGEEVPETQEVLDFMADCFEWMGVDINTRKMVSMTNHLKFQSFSISYSTMLRV